MTGGTRTGMSIDVEAYHHDAQLHALADRVIYDLGLDKRWMVQIEFVDEGTVVVEWLVHDQDNPYPVRVYAAEHTCDSTLLRARRRYRLGTA